MKRFIRVWEELDLADVEKHLIVAGDLSAECFCCHKVGIDLKARACPNCSAFFKYMGFRRKVRLAYLHQIKEELPRIVFIDFEDFKKSLGTRDARKLLDI
ncbi:MAG: hypothetical protein KAT96_01935 [Candidatus Omnitrophica bacterium]|nr:hypothetical protein [Candidatus Omnitrophota bacterium]